MSNTWWRDAADLAEEQAKFLDLPISKSLMINGPPGSGKTNLLLLRANKFIYSGKPNICIVVFGGVLKRFIQTGCKQYGFPTEKIVTHSYLFQQILREHNADFDSSNMDLEAARNMRADRVCDLLDREIIGPQYDAILLDEAQDCNEKEIRVLRAICDVFIATADFRQKIYKVDDCKQALADSVDFTYPLEYHFRNGYEICKLADGIFFREPSYVKLTTYSNYNETSNKSRVQRHGGLTVASQGSAIAAQIKAQLVAFPNELIGVLCPRRDEADAIYTALASEGFGGMITRANASNDFDPSRQIWISTLSAAKGLEFRSVHIAGLDYLSRSGSSQKKLIYTGITRAKTSLTLYWEKGIPGYLESAILTCCPQEKTCSTDAIFGKLK